jgi:hypothetical protein
MTKEMPIPTEILQVAINWLQREGYAVPEHYKGSFIPFDDEWNPPDETRDLWWIFFFPDSLKTAVRDFFVIKVDPKTLSVVDKE